MTLLALTASLRTRTRYTLVLFICEKTRWKHCNLPMEGDLIPWSRGQLGSTRLACWEVFRCERLIGSDDQRSQQRAYLCSQDVKFPTSACTCVVVPQVCTAGWEGAGVHDIYQNHTETQAVFLNMYQTQARCLESEIIIFFSRFRISNRLQNVRSWRPWLKFY